MLPKAEDLIALEPEELAGFVIEHLNSLSEKNRSPIHPDNFVNPNASPVNKYPSQYQDRIAKALMEAWEWLVRGGFLARQPGSPGWYFITRRGERMKTAGDLESYRLAEQTKIDNGGGRNLATSRENGTLLNNRYRIIKSLTKSGFAHTFLGEDIRLPSRRKCVIKQFAFTANDSQTYDQMLHRFEREAVNLERLSTQIDQVPDLYAHFPENGQYYLVQEYIEGDTLAAMVAKQGLLDELQVKEILKSTLDILKCVHAHSLIHRDIKPENVVIRESDKKPFLIDFGAIKEIASTIVDPFGNPSTTIAIGTPGYMPTEQLLGRPVFASDLYCLGLTAIFMLTGKRPQEMADLRTGQIGWRDYVPKVSSTFASLLDRAIELDFRERFPEAQDMLTALTDLDEGPSLTNQQLPQQFASVFVTSELGDSNMPQVATWWLKDFLGPVIEVLRCIQKQFNNNSFELKAYSVQPYAQVFDYRIDFFQRQVWDELLASDVGEYFLSRYPQINHELIVFSDRMDKFEQSLTHLLKTIEGSAVFLQTVIESYARLVQHTKPQYQFHDFGLEEIAEHLLGQLHLQISHYRVESKDELVRFTAYSLAALDLNFPMNSFPDDHQLYRFCRDAFKGLQDSDSSINQALLNFKDNIEKARIASTALWQQLRQERMNIANRYNATFEK